MSTLQQILATELPDDPAAPSLVDREPAVPGIRDRDVNQPGGLVDRNCLKHGTRTLVAILDVSFTNSTLERLVPDVDAALIQEGSEDMS